MNPIRGVIFDMDGTLLDSMQVWLTSGSEFLARHGYAFDEEADKIAKIASMPELGEAYRTRYGVRESWQEIAKDINERLTDQYRHRLLPKPGVTAMLDRLQKAGVPMVLATATDRCLVEPALARTGLLPYLSRIFTTTEVGVGKHDPAIFFAAAAFLGMTPQEIAVFEDALYAAKTARANGFFTVGVYDLSSAEDEDAMRKTAHCYLSDYTSADPLAPLGLS